MTIIARIKQSGEGGGQDSSEAVLEKYYEAKRELETLKQRVGSEYEDEIERLTAAKKSLEKKVGVHALYMHRYRGDNLTNEYLIKGVSPSRHSY